MCKEQTGACANLQDMGLFIGSGCSLIRKQYLSWYAVQVTALSSIAYAVAVRQHKERPRRAAKGHTNPL